MFRHRFRNAIWVLSLAASFAVPGTCANLNVLWFTAGTGDGGSFTSYQDAVSQLASDAGALTSNTWNVTFWDSSFDPAASPPSAFQVLVVASPQFLDGGDYSLLNANLPGFGNRVVVTGIDADWHYMNTPGSTTFDGPQGFLLNTVNWAGGGTGLGAVFLAPQGNVQWNFSGLGQETANDGMDSILVAPGAETSEIQAGLTSNGLSNWATSAKEGWTGADSAQWSAIHLSGDYAGQSITLASVQPSSSDPGLPAPPTPEPSGAILAISGTMGTAWLHRRRRAVRAV